MKPFITICSAIFALILLLQVTHHAKLMNITVAGHFVSHWATGISVVIALLLAFGLWREAKR
jgi:hypothetical protein